MNIVQLRKMKNIHPLWLSLLATIVMLTSCIEDEEIITYPESAITAFSIGDISTKVTFKLADGSDSTITRVVGSNEVYFNIDQVKNTIQTVDSLPHWVDLSGVIANVSSTGYVFVRHESDSVFYPFNSGTDSIDFTKPVKFLVVSTDGMNQKTYTARIFKRQSEEDTLIWNKVAGADLQLKGAHRTMVLADRMYVFAENGGSPTVTSSSFLSEGASWRKPALLECDGGAIDWQSITVFGDYLYALNSEGHICRSTNEDRGVVWSVVCDRKFTRLLSADTHYIYAYDGESIMASADLTDWRACGSNDLDMLPETFVSSACYTTRTNSELSMSVMVGLNEANTQNAVVWYKVSSAKEELDQKWGYVRVTEENAYPCPRLNNLSVVHYGDELLAIGTGGKGIYSSKDNGITWHLYTEKVMLPAEMSEQTETPVSMVAGNGHLWIVQSGGAVWKGSIE